MEDSPHPNPRPFSGNISHASLSWEKGFADFVSRFVSAAYFIKPGAPMTTAPKVGERRRLSKRATLGLLDEMDADGARRATVCVSPETLAAGDWLHLLPESDPARTLAAEAIADAAADCDTGLALYVSAESAVRLRPPLPVSADFVSARADTRPLRALLASQPTVGAVMLRLGRYAVCVFEGERILASKTDSRYMKNRHRAGGQSQRRFERSRERLVRELYDKACEVVQTTFAPHLDGMDFIALGGERNTLNGFVKRCRLMRELAPKTLSRRLPVQRPDRRATARAPYEFWKSDAAFWEWSE